MSDYLFIDVWSDVVWPVLLFGNAPTLGGSRTLEHRADVVVRHRAFELDSSAPRDYRLSLPELLAKKYSMPVERATALNGPSRRRRRCARYDLVDEGRPSTNTFDAHRVIALAATQSKGAAMSERLFRAYFCEGLLVSDHWVLTALAKRSRGRRSRVALGQ